MATKELTEDEIIEKQRIDSLAIFAKRSLAVQAEIRDYESKLKSVKTLFESEFKKLLDTNKNLEEELRNKINKVGDKNALAISSLKDAELKLDTVKKLEAELNEKHFAHSEVVNSHADAMAQDKDIILKRHEISTDIETRANALLVLAQQKMDDAIAKQKLVYEEGDKLGHLYANIDSANAIQKELHEKNEKLKFYIESIKKESDKLILEAQSMKDESIKVRDDCDSANARLAKRKEEIDEKEKQLKAMAIRQDVVSQNQSTREQSINEQSGKLSQLKTDVETLLKLKENKGA